MQCEIIDKFFITFDKILENDKLPKDYGLGVLLHNSELNFLYTINQNPDANVKDLSNILNITKGAVTQFGNKLENKGLILRYFKNGNKKEKFFKLTELGESISIKHISFRNDANRKVCSYLSTLSVHERETISKFLDKISMLPISRFECECGCYYTTTL
ncbi:MarR family winged helix-turn-helix transcriptional regulator [Miniphocaeibacter massiliensis]|uniref:MarR family winged helix-turn-helix transcriptional regulator n=1 Tax=Miniphocaeibacter massiliensis TaxID=2041841 RepID=UPI000C1BABF8|nr:MarR family transcriptional regulator [Miniphocaeibacter massiliensis]